MLHITHIDEGNVTLGGICQITGDWHEVTVSEQDYSNYMSGIPINENVPKEILNFLISEVSPLGWSILIHNEQV